MTNAPGKPGAIFFMYIIDVIRSVHHYVHHSGTGVNLAEHKENPAGLDPTGFLGRSGGIRTRGLLVPNHPTMIVSQVLDGCLYIICSS